MSQYGEVFMREEIDLDEARHLTETHLEKLGLPMGARNKLLRAFAASSTTTPPAPAPAPPAAAAAPAPAAPPPAAAAAAAVAASGRVSRDGTVFFFVLF